MSLQSVPMKLEVISVEADVYLKTRKCVLTQIAKRMDYAEREWAITDEKDD